MDYRFLRNLIYCMSAWTNLTKLLTSTAHTGGHHGLHTSNGQVSARQGRRLHRCSLGAACYTCAGAGVSCVWAVHATGELCARCAVPMCHFTSIRTVCPPRHGLLQKPPLALSSGALGPSVQEGAGYHTYLALPTHLTHLVCRRRCRCTACWCTSSRFISPLVTSTSWGPLCQPPGPPWFCHYPQRECPIFVAVLTGLPMPPFLCEDLLLGPCF